MRTMSVVVYDIKEVARYPVSLAVVLDGEARQVEFRCISLVLKRTGVVIGFGGAHVSE